jgi:serpin B
MMLALLPLAAALAAASSAQSVEFSSPDVDTQCLGEASVITESFLSEPVSEEVKTLMDDGERAFAVHVIKAIFDERNASGIRENIFISPASIYQALMLAYMGAKDTTQQELASVLGFDGKAERSDVLKNYLFERAFQAIRERDPNLGYTLVHANKLYFDRIMPINTCLQVVLQDELEAVDFGKGSEKARVKINNWVAEKTKNKISEILSSNSIDSSTKVALVNAAYFKGQWLSQFNKTMTQGNNFYVRRDKIRTTKFMEQKGKFNYYTSEELRAHVLELPYVGDQVSMLIILPPFEDDSLFETVKRLTPEAMKGVMAEINSGFYQVDELTVRIPKFKIEQTFQLENTLGQMGLRSLFDASQSNLRGFLADDTDSENGAEVSLDKAIHRSFVEVNEEGTEAAAATVLFGFRSARPLFYTEFIADHPFLFLIYDKPSDTILFFGVFQDPKL